MKKSLRYAIIFTAFFSCEKGKDVEFEVCDCLGKQIESINLEGGDVALSIDGYKIISIAHGYITPCQELPDDLRIDGQLVQVSGKLIPTCKKEHSGYAIWSQYLEITEVKKIDTLFQNGNLTIEIIKTENYGKQPGFGYIVQDKKKNFKIVQDEIPAQLGTDPFKTRADALKIALLVAHRLDNIDDFHSVYLADLHFLKIGGI